MWIINKLFFIDNIDDNLEHQCAHIESRLSNYGCGLKYTGNQCKQHTPAISFGV